MDRRNVGDGTRRRASICVHTDEGDRTRRRVSIAATVAVNLSLTTPRSAA